MPYAAHVERIVARPRHAMFALLLDIGNIAQLAPDFIKSCRVEGSGIGATRWFRVGDDPTEIAERVDCIFDGRVFAYSVITPNSLALDHYHAVVTLADAPGGGCFVSWGSNWISRVTPAAEMKPMLEQLYATLIEAMARA